MNYWKMQLHPNDPSRALEYTVSCLNRGYIGLDFRDDFNADLTAAEKDDLPRGQKHYRDFAHSMDEGDFVLVIVHHNPVALVEVKGPYNYLNGNPWQILGVWFRHFRHVEVRGYYADWHSNPGAWEKTTFTATIQRVGLQNAAYKLMKQWREYLDV